MSDMAKTNPTHGFLAKPRRVGDLRRFLGRTPKERVVSASTIGLELFRPPEWSVTGLTVTVVERAGWVNTAVRITNSADPQRELILRRIDAGEWDTELARKSNTRWINRTSEEDGTESVSATIDGAKVEGTSHRSGPRHAWLGLYQNTVIVIREHGTRSGPIELTRVPPEARIRRRASTRRERFIDKVGGISRLSGR